MHYMQAHGYKAAPTQYPTTAGLLTAMMAGLATEALLHSAGAISELAVSLKISTWTTYAALALYLLLAGALYGRLFQRAANDRRGGWLFGLAYGFLLWVIGPVTVLQWILARPLIVGTPALAVMGAQLLFGFVLGLLYPWVHLLVQRRLDDVFLLWYYSRVSSETAEHTTTVPTAELRQQHAR
jgi:hypothetical protein